MYGYLKLKFEQYLAGACVPRKKLQGIALRLKCPGFRSTLPNNFYVSTSIENLVSGVVCALENSADFAFESFNLVDGHFDESLAEEVASFIQRKWAAVPNYLQGNESLLSVAKAGKLLGYDPIRKGSYFLD